MLEATVDLPGGAVRTGLTRLQAAEFLYETRLFPEIEYTFKHALTHEVTYASVLHDRRRALHAQILETIERLVPDRLSEHIDRLAHHASRGEIWDKAVPYLREAGLRTLARSALHDAAHYFEQALVALQRLPESHTRHERAIDLAFDLRTALLPQGELQRITERLTTAEALAKAIGDRRRLGMISVFLCIHFYLVCDHADALAAADQATACGEFGAETVGTIYRALTHHSAGDYHQAIEAARAGLAALEGHPVGERLGQFILPGMTARTYLALALAEVGMGHEAVAIAKQGVEIASIVDHSPSRMGAHWGLGAAWLAVGRHEEAIAEIERAVGLCRDFGLLAYLHYMAPTAGAAYVAAGRSAEAIVLLEEVLREPAARMMICFRAPILAVLTEAYLESGDVASARSRAEAAHTIAQQHKQRGYEARIAYVLGKLASHDEPLNVQAAAAQYHAAVVLATGLGMRPLIAHCHAGLAKLYRRAGQRTESDEHFATAMTMYGDMGMTYWLEKLSTERQAKT